MSVNPNLKPSFRLPVSLPEHVDPAVRDGISLHDDAITDLQQAIPVLKEQITALQNASKTPTSSSSSTNSSSSVTQAQATTIAQTQAAAVIASTFGSVTNDTTTAFTVQSTNYGGIVTLNNASPVTVTLNPNVQPQTLFFFENLGAGTATLTPGSGVSPAGTINGAASIPLATGQGAIVFYDGKNWWAIPVGGTSGGGSGVTSIQGETGAITLTSSGATVVITTPSSSTINLESTGSGLPTNNPTFTGTLKGPISDIDQTTANPGTAPTVTLHGPAGSGATYTIGGNDTVGEILITAGTGPTTGILATINLATAYASPVTTLASIIQCVDTTVAGLAKDVQGFGTSLSTIDLDCFTAFTAGHVYSVRYFIFGY